MKNTKKALHSPQAIQTLIETVHRLRAPGGCPWDREQTHKSLRPHLIEEAYEVLEVLDRLEQDSDLKKEKNKSELREELGDLLMQVLLHSEMASEQELFDFSDVAQELNDKLIRRHPHVFGEHKVDSADAAFKNWEKQKALEKEKNPHASVLDGLPSALPALQKTARTIQKVSKVGFQWPDLQGPLQKLREELGELELELVKGTAKDPEKIQAELGDLLFCVCNVAHFLKVDPEDALRGTLARFHQRFKHVEKSLKKAGKSPENSSLEEMDRYWEEAKRLESQ